MYVLIEGGGPAAGGALVHVPGVTQVVQVDQRDGNVFAFEVECEKGADVRRDLARTVVTSGWGLLELRPMRLSLEDVFLTLTTEEEGESSGGGSESAAGPVEADAAEVAHE